MIRKVAKKLNRFPRRVYSIHTYTTMSSQQTVLRAYLLSPDMYERLQTSYKNEFTDMNYHEFLTMNFTYLSQLPQEELTWLSGLCKHIRNSDCKVVDGESCSAFDIESYYFKKDGKLCIIGAR